MITIEKHGIILSPTEKEFENNGVLNPGIFQEGNTIHILYRAVQEGNLSTIGYAKTDGPLKIVERYKHPLITRDFDYESHGVEDARIVKIEDTYYITYTAYDGVNAMGAFATSKDLIHFEKQGIITPTVNYQEYESLVLCCGEKLNPKYHHYYRLFAQIGLVADEFRLLRDKDIVFFPRKINGKFALLHRIWPGIQIVYFDHWRDLTKSFWEDYLKHLTDYIVLDPKGIFEVNYIGAGGPPIETDDGWLLIYHGVHETTTGRTYHAKAALLQIDKPENEISRLNLPLFSPTKQWEIEGEVNNVVFPTGHALFGDDLYIYYGAADKHIAVAKMSLKELLIELVKQP
ncbi:glycoside hydrolase family 130 protein [Flavobacterium psychrotolerans]|uniref:Pesticidal protein Cry7Aa n=1 Tax=Flavobacterium psychrotolerans TaxID=2169410 RepID=A0A2U1JIQ2_9FLAO|nr:pesticidal protein Cry7Aa [Flavobacterium psychrotolerans]PWA05050.1 pesticidal protein Cry7Aa [Flavobacterium psychrotolerans]